MKVISVWSPKGGAGKTTLAMHLAGAFYHQFGKRVAILDFNADQQSAMDIAEIGHLPFEVILGKPKTPPDADIVIVDHAPTKDLPPPGTTIILPYRPSRIDFMAVDRAKRSLGDGRKVFEVVNAVSFARSKESEVAEHLSREGAHIIRNLSIYSRALGFGRTIFDPKVDNLAGAREARKEILQLIDKLPLGDFLKGKEVANG